MLIDFLNYLPNKKTSAIYGYQIKRMLKEPDEFIKIAKADKEGAEKQLLDIVLYWRDKVKPTSLKTQFATIKSFLFYEDIVLNYKKIERAIPSSRMVGFDRPPTVKEIRQLLEVVDRRLRTIILIMTSSGIRLGAFDYLQIRDYEQLDNGLGKLKVYRGEKEEYTTYISPEARQSLNSYLDDRQKIGDKLDSQSPLIREVLDSRYTSFQPPQNIKSNSIARLILNGWRKCGLKTDGEGRGEFKMTHGFRKFFKTRAEKSMKTITVELLMGHVLGVQGSYYKPSNEDMEKEYINALPDLAISEVFEVKNQADAEKRGLQSELTTLRRDLGLLQSSVTALIASQVASSQIANHNHNENNESN